MSTIKPYSPLPKVGDTNEQDFGSVEFAGYIPNVTTTGTITIKNGTTTVLIAAAGVPRGQLIDFRGAFFDKGLKITLSVGTDLGVVLARPR